MPKMKLYDMQGVEKGTIELSEEIFAAKVNEAVLHASVRAYLLNQRQGTQSTKTRAEVSGGGKKPWRQKGTGRARQGSTRSPQWTHGGIALGPKPRTYRIDLNKKVKKLAMISALSSKVAENEMVIIDKIETAEYKTKTMVSMLNAVGFKKKALVVLDAVDEKVIGSLNNIEGVKSTLATTLCVYDLLNYDLLVASKAAVEKIEEVFA